MSITTEAIRNQLGMPVFNESTRSFSVKSSSPNLLTFTSSNLFKEDLRYRANTICQHIKKHPGATKLLLESLNNGPLLIAFKNNTKIGSTAAWTLTKRKITIKSSVVDLGYLLDAFIFELNNSLNKGHKNFSPADYQNAEDYAFKKETLEYKTNQKTALIMKDGVEHCGWPKVNGHLTRPSYELEEYLTLTKANKSVYKGLSHFDLLKIQFCKMNIELMNQKTEEALYYISCPLPQEQKKIYSEVIRKATDERTVLTREIHNIQQEARLWTERQIEEAKSKSLFSCYSMSKMATYTLTAAVVGVSIWASMNKH